MSTPLQSAVIADNVKRWLLITILLLATIGAICFLFFTPAIAGYSLLAVGLVQLILLYRIVRDTQQAATAVNTGNNPPAPIPAALPAPVNPPTGAAAFPSTPTGVTENDLSPLIQDFRNTLMSGDDSAPSRKRISAEQTRLEQEASSNHWMNMFWCAAIHIVLTMILWNFFNYYWFIPSGGPGFWKPIFLVLLPIATSIIYSFREIKLNHKAEILLFEDKIMSNMSDGLTCIIFWFFTIKELDFTDKKYTVGQEGEGINAKMKAPLVVPRGQEYEAEIGVTFEVRPIHTRRILEFVGSREESFVDTINAALRMLTNMAIKTPGEADRPFFPYIEDLMSSAAFLSAGVMLMCESIFESFGYSLRLVHIKSIANKDKTVVEARNSLRARGPREQEEMLNILNQLKKLTAYKAGVDSIFGAGVLTYDQARLAMQVEDNKIQQIALTGKGAKAVLPVLPLGGGGGSKKGKNNP